MNMTEEEALRLLKQIDAEHSNLEHPNGFTNEDYAALANEIKRIGLQLESRFDGCKVELN